MFWGEAYRAKNFPDVTDQAAKDKKKRFADGSCAYVTIYRPSYSGGYGDDSIKYEVVINDTLKLEMLPNSRYVLRVAKDGVLRVSVNHKNFVQNMKVDVRMGSDYYVRSYVNIPHTGKYINTGDFKVRLRGYTPYLEQIEDYQGGLESGMITQVVVMKRI